MQKVLLKSVNFNVRSCKNKNEYTIIYVVVYVADNGKNRQYKFPIGKLLAKYWDNKQQLPILTARGMSSEVREQQLAINQLITSIKCALCVGNSYAIDEIREIIESKSINIISRNEYGSLKKKKYITGVTDKESNNKEKLPNCQSLIKNQNKMPITTQFISAKRTPKATNAIKRIFKIWKENSPKSEGTLNQYYYDLKAWEKWVFSTHQRDGYSLLTIDGVFAYRDFLQKNGVTPNTINYKLRLLCQAINELAGTNERKKGIKIIDVKQVKIKNATTTKKQKEEITKDDINAFQKVETYNQREEFFKKLFLLQIATGQRISDLYTILKGGYVTLSNNIDKYIKVINKKGSRPKLNKYKYSYVLESMDISNLLDSLVDNEILDKSFNYFSHKFNVTLKELFKRANIVRNSVNGKPLCEEITSHYGRHTFATQQVRKNTDKGSIANMMGCTEAMVTNVYMHPNDLDIINTITQAQSGVIN